MTKFAFRPMLAATVKDVSSLTWPLVASPKLDGVRCTVLNGYPMSRSGKLIRNKFVQEVFKRHAGLLEGLDGELIVGSPTANDVYRATNSAVSSIEGEPSFTFYVFDEVLMPELPFAARQSRITSRNLPEFVQVVPQTILNHADSLKEYEEYTLSQGYEGVMLRSGTGLYKNGRSTLREQGLLKVKRFTDAEALCIGFGELMHNENVAKTNELGYTERSSHKENLLPGNTLGYLLCKTVEGIEFKIGTGFTQDERNGLWEQREDLIGKLVKFKFFDVGVKEAPRHPVFIGFRDETDLDVKAYQAFMGGCDVK